MISVVYLLFRLFPVAVVAVAVICNRCCCISQSCCCTCVAYVEAFGCSHLRPRPRRHHHSHSLIRSTTTTTTRGTTTAKTTGSSTAASTAAVTRRGEVFWPTIPNAATSTLLVAANSDHHDHDDGKIVEEENDECCFEYYESYEQHQLQKMKEQQQNQRQQQQGDNMVDDFAIRFLHLRKFVFSNFDWCEVPRRPGGIRQYVQKLVADGRRQYAWKKLITAAAAAAQGGTTTSDAPSLELLNAAIASASSAAFAYAYRDGIRFSDVGRYSRYGEDNNSRRNMSDTLDATISDELERACFEEVLRINYIVSDNRPNYDRTTTLSPETKEVLFQYNNNIVSDNRPTYDRNTTLSPETKEAIFQYYKNIVSDNWPNYGHTTTLSPETKEVLFQYFVTGSVDDVREQVRRLNNKTSNKCDDDSEDDNSIRTTKNTKKKKKNQLRLFVRRYPNREDWGPLCVLQEYKDNIQEENNGNNNNNNNNNSHRRIVEYYATPGYNETTISMSIVKMDRPVIAFSKTNLARSVRILPSYLVIGLVSSVLLNVQLLGPEPSLMSSFRPGVLISSIRSFLLSLLGLLGNAVRTMVVEANPVPLFTGVFLLIFAGILCNDLVEDFSYCRDVFDECGVDHLQKLPSSNLSLLYMILSNVGNEPDVPPVRTLLISAGCGILPGVIEEFLFRGVLQTALTRNIGSLPAILVQGVMFGIGHIGYRSKAYLVKTSIMGCVLGQVYASSGNLALVMLMHAGWNFLNALRAQHALRSMTAYEIISLINLGPREMFPKKKD